MNGTLTPWRILSTVLAIGFLAAPLLALTVSVKAGLVVLTLALAAVIWLAWNARDQVDSDRRPALETMIKLNAALLAVTLVAIIWLAIAG
jgi:hypothetical protein